MGNEKLKFTLVGRDLVLIRDPDTIASVLRAEGKYPQRDMGMTDGMNWLQKNRVKIPPIMGSE